MLHLSLMERLFFSFAFCLAELLEKAMEREIITEPVWFVCISSVLMSVQAHTSTHMDCQLDHGKILKASLRFQMTCVRLQKRWITLRTSMASAIRWKLMRRASSNFQATRGHWKPFRIFSRDLNDFLWVVASFFAGESRHFWSWCGCSPDANDIFQWLFDSLWMFMSVSGNNPGQISLVPPLWSPHSGIVFLLVWSSVFKCFTPNVSQCHPPRATRSWSKERWDLRTDPQKESERKQIGDSKSLRERNWNHWSCPLLSYVFILGQVAYDFAALPSGLSGCGADDGFAFISSVNGFSAVGTTILKRFVHHRVPNWSL